VNHATLARIDQLLILQPSPAHTQELDAMIAEQKDYLKEHPSDVSTHAVLAALYSARSPSDSTYAHYCSSLPPISSFTRTIDSQQLESQGMPTVATPQIRKPISRSRPRKRRARGGKTFDPTQEVDPERWLPLRERSYYKPSKSKKRKTGGATQGGAIETESMSRNGSGHVEVKKVDAKKKKKGRK
jgi:signal recognition particle subunit SRP72